MLDGPPGSWATPDARAPSLFKFKKAQVDLFSRLRAGCHEYKLGRVVRMSGQDALKIYHLLQNKYQRLPLTSHPQGSAHERPETVLVFPTLT